MEILPGRTQRAQLISWTGLQHHGLVNCRMKSVKQFSGAYAAILERIGIFYYTVWTFYTSGLYLSTDQFLTTIDWNNLLKAVVQGYTFKKKALHDSVC